MPEASAEERQTSKHAAVGALLARGKILHKLKQAQAKKAATQQDFPLDEPLLLDGSTDMTLGSLMESESLDYAEAVNVMLQFRADTAGEVGDANHPKAGGTLDFTFGEPKPSAAAPASSKPGSLCLDKKKKKPEPSKKAEGDEAPAAEEVGKKARQTAKAKAEAAGEEPQANEKEMEHDQAEKTKCKKRKHAAAEDSANTTTAKAAEVENSNGPGAIKKSQRGSEENQDEELHDAPQPAPSRKRKDQTASATPSKTGNKPNPAEDEAMQVECDQDRLPADEAEPEVLGSKPGKVEKKKKKDKTPTKEKKDKKEKKNKKPEDAEEEYDYEADLCNMIREIDALSEEEKTKGDKPASQGSGKVARSSKRKATDVDNDEGKEEVNEAGNEEGNEEGKEEGKGQGIVEEAASVPVRRRCSSKKAPAAEASSKAAAAKEKETSEPKVNPVETTPQDKVVKKNKKNKSDDEWSQDRQPDACDSQWCHI